MNILRAEKVLKYLYWIGLAFMIISIPIFNVGMSIAEIWLAALALLYFISGMFFDLNIKYLLRNPFKNPLFIIPASLYLIHIIGLLYSDDISYGIRDLRVKLPLLILPFVLTYLPKIDKKVFTKLLWLFVFSVLFSVVTSLFVYWKIVPVEFNDVRDITVSFITRISHIRLSMSIVFALAILYYFSEKSNWKIRLYSIFISLFLLYFILVIQSITGLLLILVVALFIFLRKAFQSNKTLHKTLYLISIGLAFVLLGYFSFSTINDYYRVDDDISKLPHKTALGNNYFHDLEKSSIENHHYVWINIAKDELRLAWNNKSHLDFDSRDSKNQELYMTLLRYMTSKGLKKDAEGFSFLSDNDITQIEQGVANAYWQNKPPVTKRIEAIIFEFDIYLNGGNPSGNSVTQRLEFWKAGWHVFLKHPWFGSGTGDINQSLQIEYNLMDSPLDSNHRLRCHNQYLTMAATFGIFGFVVFVVMVFYGLFKQENRSDFLYVVFTMISMLSFLTEDTLETQAGISFYSFFLVFLLLQKKPSRINPFSE